MTLNTELWRLLISSAYEEDKESQLANRSLFRLKTRQIGTQKLWCLQRTLDLLFLSSRHLQEPLGCTSMGMAYCTETLINSTDTALCKTPHPKAGHRASAYAQLSQCSVCPT